MTLKFTHIEGITYNSQNFERRKTYITPFRIKQNCSSKRYIFYLLFDIKTAFGSDTLKKRFCLYVLLKIKNALSKLQNKYI